MFFVSFSQSPSSERSQNGSSSDLRKRESRNSKPGSPSLHDPYTLFKFDKVIVLTFVLLNTFICYKHWRTSASPVVQSH